MKTWLQRGGMAALAVCAAFAARSSLEGRPAPVAGSASVPASAAPPVVLAAPDAAADTAADTAPDAYGARQAFRLAMGRIAQHQPDEADSPTLEAYPIYEYLVAARLRRDLAAAPGEALDARIDAFLAAHAGQPVAIELRREWLASLADRARWDWFLPRSAGVTDPQLACQRLAGRLATGAIAELQTDALARWSLPQRQPHPCDPVFAWLRSEGLLTSERAEAHVRAALAEGNGAFAVESLSDLPGPRSAPLRQWAQLLLEPKAMLGALAAKPQQPVEPEALLAGFDRLARHDPGSARALLPRLLERPGIAPTLSGQLARALALGAAYGRLPWVVEAFRRVPAEEADAPVQEWRARAALWSGDFRQALAWIGQMPSELGATPRWRYWHARASGVVSGRKSAAPELSALAGLRDYYGYLAADRIAGPYQLNAQPSPQDPAILAALEAEPALIRARELFACDLTAAAAVEWTTVVSALKPEGKVQAAQLAARWGWYLESVTSLAQAGQFDDVRLRYPRPYPAAVEAASELTRVPQDWILALMRQESLYRKDALSSANARGLMQLEPATAVAVARRWHRPPPSPEALFDPDVNIPLGAALLRELLDRFDGNLGAALAAYNAGAGAVDRWTPPKPIDADIWIENIPYGETRAYVQHVLEHVVAFAWTRGAEPPRLTGLLCAPRCKAPPRQGS